MELKVQREANGHLTLGVYEYAVQVLIVLSMVAFAVETLPSLSQKTRVLLSGFEIFTVAVFTLEYLIRFLGSRPRLGYSLSFWGLVDLAAILPFYLASGLDLRSLRIFRLLRLFRLLKLARYSQALQRFSLAFRMVKAELVLFGACALTLIYLSAFGIYYFEHSVQPESFGPVFHCLWWAIATLTTVGYGDVYPITTGGKAFTGLILAIGLGVVTVPSALFARNTIGVKSHLESFRFVSRNQTRCRSNRRY